MKFIPQAYPFELIDALLSYDNGSTTTSFNIPKQHILVHNGKLTTAGLIENMAQCAASGVGYMAHSNNTPPPIGFIGAIKDFKVFKLPNVGETIITRTSPVTTIGNVQIVKGIITLDNVTIAEAEYKIFLQEEK